MSDWAWPLSWAVIALAFFGFVAVAASADYAARAECVKSGGELIGANCVGKCR